MAKRPKPKKHCISVKLVKTGFTVKQPGDDDDVNVGVSFDRVILCSRCGCLDKIDRLDKVRINQTVQLHGRLIKLLYKQKLANWEKKRGKVKRSRKKDKRKKKKNRQKRLAHT